VKAHIEKEDDSFPLDTGLCRKRDSSSVLQLLNEYPMLLVENYSGDAYTYKGQSQYSFASLVRSLSELMVRMWNNTDLQGPCIWLKNCQKAGKTDSLCLSDPSHIMSDRVECSMKVAAVYVFR